jgi:hypothetical protein
MDIAIMRHVFLTFAGVLISLMLVPVRDSQRP